MSFHLYWEVLWLADGVMFLILPVYLGMASQSNLQFVTVGGTQQRRIWYFFLFKVTCTSKHQRLDMLLSILDHQDYHT